MNKEKLRRMEIRKENGTRKINRPVPPPEHRGPEYLIAFACFNCQKSFKKPVLDEGEEYSCSECGSEMYEMGRNFSAPKKGDSKQWNKVQLLYAYGFRFIGSGNHGGIELPKKLSEVEQFIQENPDHPLRVAAPNKSMLSQLSAAGTR